MHVLSFKKFTNIFLMLIIFVQRIADELIKKIYAIEETVLCSNYIQEKISWA